MDFYMSASEITNRQISTASLYSLTTLKSYAQRLYILNQHHKHKIHILRALKKQKISTENVQH
jgi:hypothetical protein